MYFIVRAAFVHIKLMMMMMIMSNDCKNTLQTQNSTSAMQENKQNIYQIQTAAELSESGKLRANSSIFSWSLKDASEDNDVRDAGKLKPIARIFQLHFCSRYYGSSFSQFNVVSCESYHFGQMTKNNDLEMEWDYSGRKGKDGQEGLSELLLTCTWSIQWWHLVEQQAEGTEWMSWHNWLASQS